MNLILFGIIKASLFLGIAVFEFRTLFPWGESLLHTEACILTVVISMPGFKAAQRVLSTDACYLQPGFAKYPILGDALNQINCSLNTIFQAAAHGPKEAQLQMTIFGTLLLSCIAITVYESFRPIHRRGNAFAGLIARATSLFGFLGQRFTAGFTTPLQLAFTAWSTSSGLSATTLEREQDMVELFVPEPEHVWSTFFSLFGYLVPTIYCKIHKMDYPSLTIWQPFPLYVLAINIVLPPILRAIRPSRLFGVLAIAGLCTLASAKTHFELIGNVRSGAVDLRDVFVARSPGPVKANSLSYAAQTLFVVDYLAVFATLFLTVIFAEVSHFSSATGRLIRLIVLTAVAGPGAAFILIWASREVFLVMNLDKEAQETKASKKE